MTKGEINHINSIDVNPEDTSPAMKQYLEIKQQNPDTLLLYRMGDFYETFFEDAHILSRELELTLTGRDSGAKLGRVPLAGIPVKAVDNYLRKLVEKGIKVAICEQLEDPKQAKGIVKRGLVRVVTPGTIIENDFLEQNSNNYICSMFEEKGMYGFAYSDVSTGEFKVTQAPLNLILSELARIKPSEIIGPSIAQKAILIKMEYNSFNSYDNQIINYVNNFNYSKFEKASMLKQIGFNYYDEYLVNYINSQDLSIDEKEEKLKDLGFTIRNGVVYFE